MHVQSQARCQSCGWYCTILEKHAHVTILQIYKFSLISIITYFSGNGREFLGVEMEAQS